MATSRGTTGFPATTGLAAAAGFKAARELPVAARFAATTVFGAGIVALLILASWATPARADAGRASATNCQADSQPKVVSDARAALTENPNNLAVQLALIDALINQGCYPEAVPVLESGLAQRPRSGELQSRMRAVRSMLSEEQFFAGLGTAQETARLQHDVMRCTKFFDVSACDDALRSKPDDPQVLVAKGDALSHEGRPADAILIYLRAGSLLPPADEGIKLKLSAAEAQREGLAAQCQVSADAAAADACQAALLRGSADELTLLQRRGILLQSLDKPEQALDAFIAASALKQDDKSVALAVVALTDSTGRKDAAGLAARGDALLLLDRPTQALQALKQAQALAPSLPGIRAQVARAEQGAKEEARRQAKLASNKAAPGGGSLAGRSVAASESRVAVASETQATGPLEGATHAQAEDPAAPNKPAADEAVADRTAADKVHQHGTARLQPAARVGVINAVTYSNDASAAQTN